ncbi:600_t:CDS:2 [Funneliformis geosporum]|nr:600_t:CDS:2 [Funneliformis geosporum]
MSESIFKQNFPGNSKNRFEFNFHDKKVIFEIDQLASKSDKSVICRYGNTTVLTVLTLKKLTKTINSFFPLTITFEEKFYAVGRIPNAFTKREGRPSYDAITAARLIDRSLRSFFPFPIGYLCPNLPFFSTPLAAVMVGQDEKGFICNPTDEKLNNSPLELIVSATEKKITMLEAGAREISETDLEKAIEFAHQEIQLLTGFFQHIANSLGVKKEKKESKLEKNIGDKWLEEKGNTYLELTKEYYAANPQLEEEFVKDLVEEF